MTLNELLADRRRIAANATTGGGSPGGMIDAVEAFVIIDDGNYGSIETLLRIIEVQNAALDGLLRNAALDWYVEQFRRDATPTPINTGAMTKVYNHELKQRTIQAYEEARRARAQVAALLKERG